MKEITNALPPETFTARERRSRASVKNALVVVSTFNRSVRIIARTRYCKETEKGGHY